MLSRMSPAASPTVRAFDAVAPDYDRATDGRLFRLQRQQAQRLLRRWLPARGRVLEIGCGTGADAAFLAGLGLEVIACDPSPEMRRLTERRAMAAGVVERVRVLDCGVEMLPSLLDAIDATGVDAIVSNFGALNCVASLDPLGRLVSCRLRPGGSVVLGLLNDRCLWERAYFTLTGRRALAGRRHDGPVPVGGIDVPTWYHPLDTVGKALGSRMTLTHVRGLGVLVPPPYLEPRWRQVPAPVAAAVTAADRVASWLPGLRTAGDHVLARWEKRRYGDG